MVFSVVCLPFGCHHYLLVVIVEMETLLVLLFPTYTSDLPHCETTWVQSNMRLGIVVMRIGFGFGTTVHIFPRGFQLTHC